MPENIACEAAHLSGDCLLDGEAVGDTFHVFDLLENCGIDHRKYPYLDRLGLLAGLIPSEFTAIKLVFTAHVAREKVHLFERLRRENKEGIVLKNLTASYSPGKTSASDQLKYKFVESASFVVTLVHPTKRSVSLGLYADSEILDAGNVTIPPNYDIPKAGSVVEVRYLYAFKQSGAIYQPVLPGRARGHRACGMHGQPVEIPPRTGGHHPGLIDSGSTNHQPTHGGNGRVRSITRVPRLFRFSQPTTTSVTHIP